ncbi:MAG TPA: JAB domain-containing protein, partial [Gemmatimonadaceae bacterium]|nr:JAB domain-containing protein [Gemmatimonadaceae bacterium]
MFELRIVRERRHGYGPIRRITDAGQVYAAFREEFGRLDREVFVVLLLDGRNQVLGFNTVSVGSLTAALVHPREVFKPVILANAAAVILVHNHPSGSADPLRRIGRSRSGSSRRGSYWASASSITSSSATTSTARRPRGGYDDRLAKRCRVCAR